jgi:iron complex outermembrane receptor protein
LTWDLDAEVSTNAYAGYTNLTYNLTDRWSVNGGIRYSYEEKEVNGSSVYSAFVPLFTFKDKDNWDDWSPTVGVNYKATENAYLYGLASKGFKSGTFVPWNNPAVGIKLDPETVWNYEIGAKTDWLDKKLRANIAGFYMNYEDMQVQTAFAPTPTYENAAKAKISGGELEILARPFASALTFNSTLSYLDAKYDDFQTTDPWGAPADATGKQMANVPKWKFTLGAQDTYGIGKYGFLTLRGDLSWTDKLYFDVLETEALSQESNTIVNALVKFETPKAMWSVEIYGKNLTNEETVSSKQYFMTNSFVVPTTAANADITQIMNPPLTVGFVVSFNY